MLSVIVFFTTLCSAKVDFGGKKRELLSTFSTSRYISMRSSRGPESFF